MATLGKNQVFEIKNGDGTSFHNLVLRKSAVESIVMSLGDKISGDVYYKDNTLSVTMHEYITYNGVNYMLINPPTIVREGVVSDNSELRGMTKYSFVFYHPMCQLSNFPFTDVAVTNDETRYLSESKTFSWIGKPADFVAKMNKNLDGTEWIVEISSRFPQDKLNELSDVIPFDNATIADACKTFYDTWGVPYVVDKVAPTEASYATGKRFKLVMGLPSNEIYENASAEQQNIPFVFQMGHGVGLKNNSRTPRNNKIITRISGYGSENNIPYGYPQVRWYGTAGQSFTYGDHAGVYTNVTIGGVHFDKVVSYPIYKGILNGEYVELIKHPFTRTHLMPSVYRTTLFNKISLYNDLGEVNTDYDPDITLVDYYDAIYSAQYPYPNTINLQAPSYESHEFEDEKPELGEAHIISATPLNNDLTPASSWDDSLDDEGNYKQSYFQMVLPQLSFDLYACASITEEMQINMRSGACLGCTFTVQVDWDDYKQNFYDEEGNFAPNGSQRDLTKYPKSNQGSISLVLQKDNSTFGTLMPNMYQYPKGETSSGAGDGDSFVILGISLPESYILAAEDRLDVDMKSYMLENNEHYFDYPLKFDEDFLFHNENILSQIRPNTVVRFNYAGQTQALFVKQITIKYGEQQLPQYDITLTDNVEVVLNQIGQVAEDVEKLSTLIAILRQSYGKNVWNELAKKLSKTQDDTAAGYITMLKGLQIGANFVPDILGEGGVLRMRDDGKVELVTDILYARMRAYFDSVVIREYKHESGNRIVSPAQGFNAARIEWIQLVEEEIEGETEGETITVTREVILEQTDDNKSLVDFFRCYWRVDDGEKKTENQFIIGDLAFCEHADVVNGSLITKRYWRVVVGRNAGNTTTEDGEAWIDLSNAHDANGAPVMTTISWEGQGGVTQTLSVKSFESSTNGIPEAHDDICMLGCVVDTTRQGAIIEYVSGVDAPTYQIYQGLGADTTNPYSLSGKNQIGFGYNTSTGRAYLNVYGDAYVGARDRSTFIEYKQSGTGGNPELNIKAHVEFTNSDSELDTLVQAHQKTYDNAIAALIRETEDLQAQIDGAIESYFMEGVPSLTTPPVMNTEETHYEEAWLTGEETQEERIAILNKHIGDLYYDKETGHGYRFLYDDDTSAYVWTILTDEDVTEALRLASEAQETADGKSTTFLNNTSDQDESKRYPTNYKKGDTWILQVDATIGTTAYKAGDILTASTDSETYSAAHWSKQVRYTDDTKADSILNNSYYQQLTGGTISQNITNAANAASAAQSAATTAQSTANAAQTSAAAANTKLSTWADDGVISPTEKLALKNQKADVEKEYAQIIVDAAKYTGVSTTAFTTAYNRAITAFNYYTSDSPEDITIITDEDEDTDATPRYSRISAYYAARQTVLNDFATAAKKYATDKAAEAAEAFKSDAVYRALKSALGSKTDIVGGLVLTSLIGMRQNTGTEQSPVYTTWGGISGEYDSLAKGGGIAAWYGGDMFDREDVDDSSSSSSEEDEEPRYATSLFRFDGSGYLASGNITWNENGVVTIANVYANIGGQDQSLTGTLQTLTNLSNALPLKVVSGTTYLDPKYGFTNLSINGNEVATKSWANGEFVSKTWFSKILKVHYKQDGTDKTLSPNNDFPNDATDKTLESVFSFWTNYAISALGQGVDGSHAIGVLDDLNDVTISNPVANQILKYNGTHWVNGAAPETYVLPQATSDALGGIKIGYAASGKNYAIALDTNGKAYVNVPWTDTTYTLAGLMGSTSKGSATQPIYWNGTAFVNTTYTLGKSVPSDAVFTDHYAWGDITSKPTTISGYGITDAYTKDDSDGRFLRITGYTSLGASESNPVDLNNITTYGVYRDSESSRPYISNRPITNNAGFRLVVERTGFTSSSYVRQIYREYNKNIAYERYSTDTGSSWSSWVKVQDNLENYASASSVTTLQGYFTNGVANSALKLGSSTVGGSMTPIYLNGGTATACSHPTSGSWFGGVARVNSDGIMEVGRYIDFHPTSASTADFTVRLDAGTGTTERTFTFPNTAGTLLSTGNTSVSLSGSTLTVTINGTGQSLTNTWRGIQDNLTSSTNTTESLSAKQGYLLANGSARDNTKLPLAGGVMTGNITLSNEVYISGTNTDSVSYTILGLSTSNNLLIGYGLRSTYNTNIYGKNIRFYANSSIRMYIASGGNVGIGTTSPSYKLHVSGDVYATGGVTSLSDIRKKDVVSYTLPLNVEQIANAPTIKFLWKDKREEGEQVGTIAQYWQKVLPDVVKTGNDEMHTLSLSYGVAALVAAITTARKVVDHEREIAQLKNRVKTLEDENKMLKTKLIA